MSDTNIYRYRMISTGGNSHKYGDCQICGEHATEVFHQIEEEKMISSIDGEQWTRAHCSSYFGHKECLISKQRNGNN